MQIPFHLIEACQRNERPAQKQLYELLLPYLGAVANRYLRNSSYLKDALQESFIKIFQHLDRYSPDKGHLKSWASTIVIRTCLDMNQRVIGQSSEEFSPELHERPAEATAPAHLSDEHLLRVLKKMPPGYFEVFNLYVIDGYHHEEIAELLHIDPALSRKRLSRAKEWLRKSFDTNPGLLSNMYPLLAYLN